MPEKTRVVKGDRFKFTEGGDGGRIMKSNSGGKSGIISYKCTWPHCPVKDVRGWHNISSHLFQKWIREGKIEVHE